MCLSECFCWRNSLLSDKEKPYKWTDTEARQKHSLPGQDNEEWRCASIWQQHTKLTHKNGEKEGEDWTDEKDT